jgi:hypothetical protein
MRTIPFLALTVGALLMAGCGGGGDGGDGGGDTGGSAPVVSVAITSANQANVARAAIDGGVTLGRAQPLESDDRTSAQSVSAAPRIARVGILDAMVRRALTSAFAPRRSIASATRPAATTSDTEACTVSGSVTISVDDVDNSGTLSASDKLSITFNQCRESSTDLANGAMVFTIGNVVSATSERTEFGATLAFLQVTAAEGETFGSIHGTVSVGIVLTSSSVHMGLTVGGGGLTVTSNAGGQNDSIVYDPGMQIVVDEALTAPASSTVSLNGSFTATSIGGRVALTTMAPIVQAAADSYPGAGQLRVAGAAGSVLRITVIDTSQVRLELDAAGDGTYETTTMVAWSSLRPL